MIIRGLTVSLLFAVLALPAYGGTAYAQDSAPIPQDSGPVAQDNPQTRQTDEAEDDYRRSQRRRDTGDIFDDIDINTRSGGGGGNVLGREVKAIDRLDQESRRHLNKQRAKALAEANPGEPIDAAYEPSEVAKTDEYVAKQEQRAWDEMMRDANSGLSEMPGQGTGGGQGTAQGDQSGQGQPGGGQQGQSGQGSSGQGQGSQGEDGQSGQQGISPLRGGSASSASSILDQIRGRSGSGGGNGSEQGQTSQGQTQQGSAQQSQSTGNGQSQGDAQAQSQAEAEEKAQAAAADAAQAAAEAQALSQNGADAATQAEAQAKAEAAAEAAANAQANAAAQAEATAQAQADALAASDASATNAAAEAAAHHETISPLERLKRDPVERDDVGGRTSASDYLNRTNK